MQRGSSQARKKKHFTAFESPTFQIHGERNPFAIDPSSFVFAFPSSPVYNIYEIPEPLSWILGAPGVLILQSPTFRLGLFDFHTGIAIVYSSASLFSSIKTTMSASGAFGPAPPGVNLAENQNANTYGAVITIMIIGTAAVALRAAARMTPKEWNFAIDDYLVVLALVSLGAISLSQVSTTYEYIDFCIWHRYLYFSWCSLWKRTAFVGADH